MASLETAAQTERTFSILLVDDSEMDAQAVIWRLEHSHYKFKIRYHVAAEHAADFIANEDEIIDVLLTDYDLLGMTGLELCHFVQEQRPEIANVLMTGYGNEYLAAQAIKSGVNEYVVKDSLGDYLDDLPEQLLAIWERHYTDILAAHAQREQEREIVNTINTLRSQNAELDSFAQTVAHDLKNPLSALSGLAELLGSSSDTISDADVATISQSIASCGQKAINIVDELLKLGRSGLNEIEVTPVNTGKLLVETLFRLTTLHDKINPIIHEPENWPQAIGYEPWIEEVWTNYVSNAMKYGGRPCEIWLGGEYQADGLTRFWVRDNGRGLTEAEKSHLFQPYTRLHFGSQDGNGLGLSIVRRIVERQGGSVGVCDAPGGGCEFWFTIPTGLREIDMLSEWETVAHSE
ncbi:MAG: hybrid sensor histidine kinase/response regulator [Anaerolineales bacterium]|nr:hybrid sensor histidine kinase/response regulator [Anaerolineales bacterium]